MSRDVGGGGGKIFPRYSVSEDVDREIRAHVEERAEELEREGWEPAAAREEAARLFGDRDAVARKCREIATSQQRAVRRSRTMDAIWQDLKYAARTLIKSPGFAVVAIVTLALGIGANTAIFSVVYGVLLQPLPWEQPQDLTFIREATNRGGSMDVAYPNYIDWRDENRSYSALAAVNYYTTTVLGADEPVRAVLDIVGRDYWKVFPTRPVQGRLTNESDHQEGAAPVVVVSRSFWQNELGSRPIESFTLEISGIQASVIGVIPDGAGYPADAQIWTPLESTPQSSSATSHNFEVVARLAPGVSLAQATEEVDALTKRIVLKYPDEDGDYLATGARTVRLVDEIVGDVRLPLLMLLAAAGLVLLVACTNLASTLLARGAARDRELAVRASLGAGRGRIARQLLTESLLLSGLGGVAGVGLAWVVVRAIRATGPAFLPRLSNVSIDAGVLGYTALVAVLTALLFGLLPARRLAGAEASQALRSGSRGNAADARSAVWKLLVGTEVALALVLLAGSGLLVRSFRTVLSEKPGFDASDVDVMSMSLSQIKYPEDADFPRFYDGFLPTLASIPGVSAVGVVSSVPIQSGPPNGRLDLDGDPEKHIDAYYVLSSGGAFDALDIPLLQGRYFDDRDRADAPHVAIVSRAFAEKAWPGEDPIGKSVSGGGMDNFWGKNVFSTVVGVVDDVRSRDLTRAPYPTVYFSYAQRPFRLRYSASVVVEASDGSAANLIPALRDRLRAADSDVPVRIRTLDSYVRDSLGTRRFTMVVLGGFSLVALILAAVGIFGVVSYSVARRTREMGIRMALGADPGGVLRMMIKASLQMVLGGLVLGLIGSLVVTRLMRSFLYEVSPTDPVSLAGAATALLAAALLASWLPARAGTRVDPMITMRSE